MSETFQDKLTAAIEKKNSLLCIGLDPQMDIAFEDDVENTLFNFANHIIEQTIDYAACYKPNIAFYEQFGPEGLMALKKILDLIPDDTPVIIDAKRSDIGNTAQAYAKSLFGNFNADAVTLGAYMGQDAIHPFLEYDGKGIFILCRTSNPGAPVFQSLLVNEGNTSRELYLKVAEEASSWSPHVGLVVAGNDRDALKAVRSILPGIWILAPGIGTQGGDITEALQAGIGRDGHNILLNVSRGISQAPLPGKTAKEFRDQINKARQTVSLPTGDHPFSEESPKKTLIRDIIQAGCFQLGNFTLKSGKISPFYLDLRKLISHPKLLARVTKAYSSLIRPLKYDRIAGIPLASLAFAALISHQLNAPLIIPRIQKKAHGTGNTIEGDFQAGEKILLVDDLITTGTSVSEALEVIIAADLEVTDFVVLVERGVSGRKNMEELGLRLHSFCKIDDFFDVCLEMGLIDTGKQAELQAYVRN